MKKFILNTQDATLSFQEGSGRYTVKAANFVLADCKPVLKLNGKEHSFGSWKVQKHTPNNISAAAEGRSGTWRLEFSSSHTGAVTVALNGKLHKSCDHIEILYFEKQSIKADHLLSLGITKGRTILLPLVKGTKQNFTGALQFFVTRNEKQFYLSYPLSCNFMPFFEGKAAAGKIMNFRTGADINHYAPRQIALEPLTFRSGNGLSLMQEYAEENLAPEMKGRDFSSIAKAGWNSWDYYRWTITEDEVLANAEFIAADPVLSRYVKRIIIDDGWQYAYGEWEANSLFPHGMKYLAGKIAELGFEPGLWVAPVVIEPHARIAQLNPEMLAGAESGLPALAFECMKRHGFLLDPTVEKSRQFLSETFERLLSYGFRYFKLDFIGSLLKARCFADRKIPCGKLMDLSVGTIRKTLAGRAPILGCNYLFCGGAENVDAVRVASDIHSKWDAIRSNTPSIAGMFWANKKLWLNDPDFALCRGFDTSNDPDMNRLKPCLVYIPPENTDKKNPEWLWQQVDNHRPQCEVLLSLVIASAGSINLSDRMMNLNESGLDLARRTVSAEMGDAAVPLDLFSSALPKFWLQKVKDYHRVLLINWEDQESELRLDLRKHGVSGRNAVDFWSDRKIPLRNGCICAILPPRSCLFAVLRS